MKVEKTKRADIIETKILFEDFGIEGRDEEIKTKKTLQELLPWRKQVIEDFLEAC